MTNFKELVHTYLDGAATLRKTVAEMTREQVLARPVAGRWSTLECIAHIADFEPIMAERMKRILSLDRPLLLVADENLFASALSYHQRDIEEELSLIELTRKQMSHILLGLHGEEASRVGIHSFRGLVTLEAVLNSAIHHIPHHLQFIEEKKKALGC